MKAIISDIHSNIEALKAVLDDIAVRKITEIICLGDIVGYGPNPVECLELAEKFAICIKGNHEEAVLSGAVDFNHKAEEAINWTRDRIGEAPTETSQRLFAFIESLKDVAQQHDMLMVHGTPRIPTRDYLFPRDIRDKQKFKEIFDKVERYCFVGHSHIPGVFVSDGRYLHPSDLMAGIYILDEEKCVINVGSVGQPRDNDPRASYCTFDGDSVVFRRVEYDCEPTVKKIHDNKRLQNSLGDRLVDGR